MSHRQLFPLGKAYGQAFCNRTEETKKLIGHISSGKHVFMAAPRRYGKSSLCEHVFTQINFPHKVMDLHMAVTDDMVGKIIVDGITDTIYQSIGKGTEKLMLLAKQYAKKIQPKLGVGPEYLRLELNMAYDSSAAENIFDAIMLLEKLLQNKNKQVVLLLDEFQEIAAIDKAKSIEGAIRSAAQETQNLSIIFCGSNPHILSTMFEDERRPLYKLYRKVSLGRIAKEHYHSHLNNAAKLIWGDVLQEDVFDQIMNLTERHPYYVNYLCDELCSISTNPPTLKNVNMAWEQVAQEERSDLLKDYTSLPINQKKLMIYLANNVGVKNMYSIETSKESGIAISSMARALESLQERDFIQKEDGVFYLTVPIYRQLLKKDDSAVL